jgi:Uma2 family endonuclease
VVCREITKDFLDFPAALVVEMLSYSPALKDRNVKMHFYAEAGISYYVIIDSEKETIEIYQLNSKNEYELNTYQPSGPFIFTFGENCSAEVMLHEIWH